MITLNVSEVISLHEKLVAATGGSPGLRDIGLLESAVLGCYQSFGNVDLYPSIIEKAARIAYAVAKNHPFIDGNKRVAVTSMLVMLRLNQIVLSYTQDELITLGLGIADGSISYDEIRGWINGHLNVDQS
jgi:death-on-curing protein